MLAFYSVEESSYELRKIKPVRKDPFAAWASAAGNMIDRSGGPIEKKKRPRSCKQEAKTRCANIKASTRKRCNELRGGKSMWKEVRMQKRVRSLASNVIFVNRWNAPKLAWLKPSVYCNASHILLTQSRLTNFFIINHNGWTMSGETIRRMLKEQKLIFTVEKNALMLWSPSPPFF